MFGLSIWFDLLPVQAEKEETETWLFKVKQTEAEEGKCLPQHSVCVRSTGTEE